MIRPFTLTLSLIRLVFALTKVSWKDSCNEFFHSVDFESPSVGKPGDNVCFAPLLTLVQHLVQTVWEERGIVAVTSRGCVEIHHLALPLGLDPCGRYGNQENEMRESFQGTGTTNPINNLRVSLAF